MLDRHRLHRLWRAARRGRARALSRPPSTREIARIIKDGVTDEELERAKNRFVRAMIFARDNQAGMANIYGSTLATGGTVEGHRGMAGPHPQGHRRRRSRPSPPKYLNPDHSVAGYLLPPGADEGLSMTGSGSRFRNARSRIMTGNRPFSAACSRRCLRRWLVGFVLAPAGACRAGRDGDPGGQTRRAASRPGWSRTIRCRSSPCASPSRGGSTQDPAGKEGLANLMTGLFDEGAGDLDSDAFQEQLDDAGAEMRFDAGRDALLRLDAHAGRSEGRGARAAAPGGRPSRASTRRRSTASAPRSCPASIARRQRSRDRRPDRNGPRRSTATIPMRAATRAPKPSAGQRSRPTISRRLHKRLFARADLIIGVVGAIDAETLKRELDKVFGDLPEKAGAGRRSPTSSPKLDQQIRVAYDLPQTTLQLAYPGVAARRPGVLRGVSDEPHSRRRHLHLAAVRRGARKARAGLRRRFHADQQRPFERPGDRDSDPLRPRRRDASGDPRRGQAHGRGWRRPRRSWRQPRST